MSSNSTPTHSPRGSPSHSPVRSPYRSKSHEGIPSSHRPSLLEAAAERSSTSEAFPGQQYMSSSRRHRSAKKKRDKLEEEDLQRRKEIALLTKFLSTATDDTEAGDKDNEEDD